MSLFSWLTSLFSRAPRRNISRLSDVTDDRTVEEIVDVSGGPLKEGHLRRALRDQRLLPKKKSVGRALGLTKRRNVMSRDEADRLFAATMRTRNRSLRDLLVDEVQLQRYGLPVWKTEEDLANALGLTRKQLRFFSLHREKERQPHYVMFTIPKRSGGERLILAPKRRLKALQRSLLRLLVEKLPVSDRAHAFRRGHSIRTGAEPHVGKRYVLHLDLKDFFPTVTVFRVRGFLIAYGYSYPVASALATLMTESERQPVEVEGEIFHVPVGPRHCVQGAPTSPGLCNALLLRLDRRLAGLAAKAGAAYTRYADDLTFSGDLEKDAVHKLRAAVTRIISEEGFQVNPAKTRIMSQGVRQAVTGVVVNQVPGLSRQERRKLRAAIHQFRGDPSPEPGKAAWLTGKLAYLRMLNPQQAERLDPKPPTQANG